MPRGGCGWLPPQTWGSLLSFGCLEGEAQHLLEELFVKPAHEGYALVKRMTLGSVLFLSGLLWDLISWFFAPLPVQKDMVGAAPLVAALPRRRVWYRCSESRVGILLHQ